VGDLFGLNVSSFNMSETVPFLTTKYLDFTGLNNILAYDSALLEAMRIHLTCMLVSVVTVMSSINPLLDVRHISVFALVSLDSHLCCLDNHV